jgi:tetratricopeptide (TPR) repeat protein
MGKNLSETQPSPPASQRARKPAPRWIWALIAIALLGGALTIGSLGGYLSTNQSLRSQQAMQASEELQRQFELGVEDLEAGRYEVAKQRFEYVVSLDPTYPGVMENLAMVMQVLYATATPTPLPSTATATPTQDLRPIEELFNQAVGQFANGDWDGAIDTLSALRKQDRAYQTARVDGMLFLSLRSRGVAKILSGGNLEGGTYDLALAERFGPLDVEAGQARQWARLYIIGLSFWEVHPEQAVYYFSQVAAALPYLSDASGWTAIDRYRAALIQYGDLLAGRGEWCPAMQQYQLALEIRSDGALVEVFTRASENCLAQTITPTLTVTPTLTTTGMLPVLTTTATPTPTETQSGATQTPLPITATPTPTTSGGNPTATNTPPPASTATSTPQPQETPYPAPAQ